MVVVNSASLLFALRYRTARFVLAAWIGNAITMGQLFEWNGYNRLLGLSHVLWWTPLLWLLWRTRSDWPKAGPARAWLLALFATNATSLVIDYVDVVRYLLGDRAT
jgi:hypothetical protein